MEPADSVVFPFKAKIFIDDAYLSISDRVGCLVLLSRLPNAQFPHESQDEIAVTMPVYE